MRACPETRYARRVERSFAGLRNGVTLGDLRLLGDSLVGSVSKKEEREARGKRDRAYDRQKQKNQHSAPVAAKPHTIQLIFVDSSVRSTAGAEPGAYMRM